MSDLPKLCPFGTAFLSQGLSWYPGPGHRPANAA